MATAVASAASSLATNSTTTLRDTLTHRSNSLFGALPGPMLSRSPLSRSTLANHFESACLNFDATPFSTSPPVNINMNQPGGSNHSQGHQARSPHYSALTYPSVPPVQSPTQHYGPHAMEMSPNEQTTAVPYQQPVPHPTPPPNRYRHSFPHHSELAANGLYSATGIVMAPPGLLLTSTPFTSSGHTATLPRNIRNIRNQAEKQRRNKLNGYINDLATIVPFITMSKKRQDKTSILRLSAAYIRIKALLRKTEKEGLRPNGSTCPSTASRSKLNAVYSALVDSIESFPGFSLIMDYNHKILFVTSTVEKYLGYQDNEMIGQVLENFLHHNDVQGVASQLNIALDQVIKNEAKESERITFDCRLREKNQPRYDSTVYRTVRISGHMTSEFADNTFIPDEIPRRFSHHHHHQHLYLSPSQLMSPPRMRSFSFSSSASSPCPHTIGANGSMYDDSPLPRSYSFSGQVAPGSPDNSFQCDYLPQQQPSPTPSASSDTMPTPAMPSPMTASNMIFLCFVEILPANPQNELKLSDATFDEYISRHSLDGTLLYADHRISSILGFFPTEVCGKSAYDFILPDDYSIALFAHKLMLSNSNGTGVVVHRLRSIDGSAVFLQTAGCLQYNSAGQIDHFICVSRMLVESEGEKERVNFVKRFTPHIHNQSPLDLYESLKLVINPFSSGFANSAADPARAPSPAAMAIAAAQPRAKKLNRLLPARFDRKNAAPDLSTSRLDVESPSSRQSISSNSSEQMESPKMMDLLNQMTVQAAIKHLEENQDNLLARAQQVQKEEAEALRSCSAQVNAPLPLSMECRSRRSSSSSSCSASSRKRDSDTTFHSPTTSKKSRLSCNSTTGMSSSLESPHQAEQLTDDIKIEDAVPIQLMPQSPPYQKELFNFPHIQQEANKQKYKLTAGQRDYTHLLGARVLTYDAAKQAKVLSIYTPQEALDAQQRGTLLTDAPAKSSYQSAAPPSTEPKEEDEEKYECQYPSRESAAPRSEHCRPHRDHHMHSHSQRQHYATSSSDGKDDKDDVFSVKSTVAVAASSSSNRNWPNSDEVSCSSRHCYSRHHGAASGAVVEIKEDVKEEEEEDTQVVALSAEAAAYSQSFRVPTSAELALTEMAVEPTTLSIVGRDDGVLPHLLPNEGNADEIVLLEEMASASGLRADLDQIGQHHHHHHHHHLHHLEVPPDCIGGVTVESASVVDISSIDLEGPGNDGLNDSSAEVSYSFLPVPVYTSGGSMSSNHLRNSALSAKLKPVSPLQPSRLTNRPHMAAQETPLKNDSAVAHLVRRYSQTYSYEPTATFTRSGPTDSSPNPPDYTFRSSKAGGTASNPSNSDTTGGTFNYRQYSQRSVQQRQSSEWAIQSRLENSALHQRVHGDYRFEEDASNMADALIGHRATANLGQNSIADGGPSFVRPPSRLMYMHETHYQRKEELMLPFDPRFKGTEDSIDLSIFTDLLAVTNQVTSPLLKDPVTSACLAVTTSPMSGTFSTSTTPSAPNLTPPKFCIYPCAQHSSPSHSYESLSAQHHCHSPDAINAQLKSSLAQPHPPTSTCP